MTCTRAEQNTLLFSNALCPATQTRMKWTVIIFRYEVFSGTAHPGQKKFNIFKTSTLVHVLTACHITLKIYYYPLQKHLHVL